MKTYSTHLCFGDVNSLMVNESEEKTHDVSSLHEKSSEVKAKRFDARPRGRFVAKHISSSLLASIYFMRWF